jgi:hypothetical protein
MIVLPLASSAVIGTGTDAGDATLPWYGIAWKYNAFCAPSERIVTLATLPLRTIGIERFAAFFSTDWFASIPSDRSALAFCAATETAAFAFATLAAATLKVATSKSTLGVPAVVVVNAAGIGTATVHERPYALGLAEPFASEPHAAAFDEMSAIVRTVAGTLPSWPAGAAETAIESVVGET